MSVRPLLTSLPVQALYVKFYKWMRGPQIERPGFEEPVTWSALVDLIQPFGRHHMGGENGFRLIPTTLAR